MPAPNAFDRVLARCLETETVEQLARRLGTGTEYIRIRTDHVREWDERERQRAGFDGGLPFPEAHHAQPVAPRVRCRPPRTRGR